MAESLEVEHQRRLRAERVQSLLQLMWGDELPPGRNPALTVLVDAVGVDDAHSIEDRIVSQGDGLSYQLLGALWRHYLHNPPADLEPYVNASGVELHLPQVLDDRLRALRLLPAHQVALAGVSPATTTAEGPTYEVDPRSGPTPVVAEAGESAHVGMWEMDPQTATMAFDAVTARLMGVGQVGGYAAVDQHLTSVHPQDRERVASALHHAMSTETAFRVRFRVRSPLGVITHVISHGRVLRKPSDPSARLTGYLTIDREGQRAQAPEGDPPDRGTARRTEGTP